MEQDLSEKLLEVGFMPFKLDELNAEEILKEEKIKYLVSIAKSDEKIRQLNLFQARAEKLKVKTAFNKLYKQYNQEHLQYLRGRESNLIQYSNSPIDNLKCGKYTANDTGVFKIEYDNNFQAVTIEVCPHPIMPIERIINVTDGIEKIKLAFYKDSKWNEIIVQRNTIASKNKIIMLANDGIEVNEDNAKELITFLSAVIKLNIDKIPTIKGITRLGWVEELFVPYTNEFKYDGDNSFKSIFESIKEKGNYNEWNKTCIDLRSKSKILHLMIASSFASPLIELLNINPFIVHLWGKSGTGKTVALMIAMSVWGNPAVGKLVKNLNSTNVGFERTSSFLRNIPFAGDELQSIKVQYKNYDELIYKLTQGEGKNQGTIDGGIKEQQQWHCIYLTTGEEPITSEASKEGVKNRVIEIEENEVIVENGNQIVNILKENYGFAGKEYIQNLPDIEKLKTEFSSIQNELLKKYNGSGKQTNAIATIMLADRIASKIIFKDNALEINDMEDIFTKDIDEADRIYNLILDWFYQNINKFKNENEIGEVWGKYDEAESKDCKKVTAVYIIPKVLKSFLLENNISFDGIKKKLFDNGYIEKDCNGKYTSNTKINGIQMRIIKLLVVKKEEKTDMPF